MANITVEKFQELVQRCQLIEKDQLPKVLDELKKLVAQLEKESKESGEPGGVSPPLGAEKLGDYLVEHKWITRWQCDQLLKRRHKGFFLGKYKLLGLLGKGGMSSVYLAEHVLMQSKRAIKVLPQHKVNDSTYLPRFYREARAAARLDHKNIVRAYDIDNEENIHYLIMEYIDGRDVHQIVKRDGTLDFETAADFTCQAADGLAHAHEMGLIHRDIKPANLLVDQKNVVKVLDMGLARFAEDNASLTVMNDENVLGTADYLSPEQALDSHNVDYRTDIYSLGCTIYYMLTGHPPFPDGTLAQRILKHQKEEPASILEDRPDAPEDLIVICQKMMAKDLNERFQTAEEVRDILADWLGARGGEGSGTGSGGSGSSGKVAVGAGQDVGMQFSIDTDTPKQSPRPRKKRPGGPPPRRRSGSGSEETTHDFDQITTEAPTRSPAPKRPAPAKKTPTSPQKTPQSPAPKAPAAKGAPVSKGAQEGQFVIDTSTSDDTTGRREPSLMERRTSISKRQAKKPPIALWIFLGGLGGLAVLLIILNLLKS